MPPGSLWRHGCKHSKEPLAGLVEMQRLWKIVMTATQRTTEKRIEMLKLLQTLQEGEELPGETVLRALRLLATTQQLMEGSVTVGK